MSWQMGAPPPPPPPPAFSLSIKPLEETRADLLQDYALNNLYMGPPTQGDMFAGWPMGELVKKVLPNVPQYEQMHAVATLKVRHGLAGLGSIPYPLRPSPPRPYTPEECLAMRMQWGRIEDGKWAPGFEHVAIHSAVGSSVVHLWVITKQGQSVVLEDEAPLFPSDALITKLNMLKE